MDIIKWDDSLSVGYKRIDDQHKKLIEVINDLNEAIEAGKGSMVYDELFQDVAEYFTENFSTEEDLMRAHDFTGYEDHRRLHDSFALRVKELRSKAVEGDESVSREALSFLTEWLVLHDISVDKKLGAFLVERGVE